MIKLGNNIDLILDTLTGTSALLFFLLGFGTTLIKKRLFDYYEVYSKAKKHHNIEKKPFRVHAPLDIQYLFKPLPSKSLHPDFYKNAKSQSLLSELRGFTRIFAFLFIASVILTIIAIVVKYQY